MFQPVRPSNRDVVAFLTAVPGLQAHLSFKESGVRLTVHTGEQPQAIELDGEWDGSNLADALLDYAHALAVYACDLAEEAIEQRHFEDTAAYLIMGLRDACPNHPNVLKACYAIMGPECPSKLGIPSDEDVRMFIETAVQAGPARDEVMQAIDLYAPKQRTLGTGGSYNLTWAFDKIADRLVGLAPELAQMPVCPNAASVKTFLIRRLQEMYPGHPRVESASASLA
jgi:hypothetical protein